MIPCPKTIAWASLTKDNGSIPLPRSRVDWLLIAFKYKVTDAGIAAGETIFGAIDRISVGDPNRRVLVIESNEIGSFVGLMNGFQTGQYSDAMPTTATTEYSYALIKGPFQFAGMQNPEVFVEIGAITDEWGGATAFECEVSAAVLLSDEQVGPGYIVERQYRPTSTRQEILGLGPGLVEDIAIIQAAVSNCSRVEINREGLSSPMAFERPYELNAAWKADTCLASDTTSMLIENIDLPLSNRRSIVITNGTTDTCLALMKNLVSA